MKNMDNFEKLHITDLPLHLIYHQKLPPISIITNIISKKKKNKLILEKQTSLS